MTQFQWEFYSTPEESITNELAKALSISKTLASLLVQKGIYTFEDAKTFFRPELSHLHDPKDLKGCTKAAKRILKAIENREKVLVYGDYDVDGTTSVALVFTYLSKYLPALSTYIPDRYLEGYGVSEKVIDKLIEEQYDLMITLDCGIKDVNSINRAASNNVDVIVCDHHTPGELLPDAFAILDPKQKDCNYPYSELSGCGVGFKLLQEIAKTTQDQNRLFDLLDFVAISIAADIVPITKENRALAFLGLQKINENTRAGIQAMIQVADKKLPLSIEDVLFGIAPRINAAGRIHHAKHAVSLLTSTDEEEAKELSKGINIHNEERKTLDSQITKEALAMLESNPETKNNKSTVLYKKDWHKGVIGIVASRCIEQYYKPTIILTESNGKATGSARSVQGFNVYNAIAECKEFLDQFGGHAFAAGMAMPIDNVEPFKKAFEEVVQSTIQEQHLKPIIKINSTLGFNAINKKFYNIIAQMAPFGPGNMEPVFYSDNLYLQEEPKLLKSEHLKITVSQLDSDQHFDAIGFFKKNLFAQLSAGQLFKMAYCLQLNTFRGRSTLQLRIKDIKFEE